MADSSNKKFQQEVEKAYAYVSRKTGIPVDELRSRANSVGIGDPGEGTAGIYYTNTRDVVVSPEHADMSQDTLVHEIMHSLQKGDKKHNPLSEEMKNGERGGTPVTPYSPEVQSFRNLMSPGGVDKEQRRRYIEKLRDQGVPNPEEAALDVGMNTYLSEVQRDRKTGTDWSGMPTYGRPAYPSLGLIDKLRRRVGIDRDGEQTPEQLEWVRKYGNTQLTPEEQRDFISDPIQKKHK